MYEHPIGYDIYFDPDIKPGGPAKIMVLEPPYARPLSAMPEYAKPPGLDDMTYSFLEQVVHAPPLDDDDFLNAKVELGEDRIKLMTQLVEQQNHLHYQNLSSLYRDIFSLDKMQHERPFPECYAQDQTWLRLTEDKLKLYDQVRREVRDHAKSLSFIARDLVGALVEHKGQKRKSDMLNSDLILDDEGGY